MPRLFPSAKEGLTSEQVDALTAAGWYNAPVESPSKSIGEIIRSHVFTYFNLIFVIFAVMLISVGSFRDLTFVPVILSNTLIGIIQEIRAKKTLDALTMLHAPKSVVIRDGEKKEISSEALVRDDILVLKAGDQIPADAVVAEGEAFVNESLLTGEADEVHKEVEDE
ncbi:MAG: cation-translocating P-type ATPase, partial [Lachnospiraceae bacterium]|nr:cation-translocating P-type ATPase [Lachnospiraceae bacterium]